jgi:peptidoglycan biosynthesis protein MviN/MurJ (putative lipid II flippase)
MWRPMLLGTAFVAVAYPLYATFGELLGVQGLALAGAVAISLNALATLALARWLHGAPALLPLGGTLLRSLAGALPAAAAAMFAARALHDCCGLGGTTGALLELAAGGTLYLALALPAAWLLGDATTRETLARLVRRVAGVLRRRS